MLERIHQTAPLPCFALEYMLMPDRCKNCPHRVACRGASQSRLNLVPLRVVQIDLQPRGLPDGDDAALVASEFQLYHRAVLLRPAPTLSSVEISAVLANATEAGAEPGQLILAALLGHRARGEDRSRPFYGRMLVGKSAMNHLIAYREICATRYGTFDTSLLGDVAQLPRAHNVTARLQASEELAATWGVKAALSVKRSIVDDHLETDVPLGPLYSLREGALDPWWLATEPTYATWLIDASEQEDSHEIHRHRQRVRLAATRPGLRAVVKARNAIARTVAHREATRLGLNLDHVLVVPVFSEPARLWRAIAHAAATSEALNILSA